MRIQFGNFAVECAEEEHRSVAPFQLIIREGERYFPITQCNVQDVKRIRTLLHEGGTGSAFFNEGLCKMSSDTNGLSLSFWMQDNAQQFSFSNRKDTTDCLSALLYIADHLGDGKDTRRETDVLVYGEENDSKAAHATTAPKVPPVSDTFQDYEEWELTSAIEDSMRAVQLDEDQRIMQDYYQQCLVQKQP